jgi:flagellin-like protein
MKQKRGISPLIATILLIGFTVVLAAVVLTWGQGWFGGLTEGTTESTSKDLACINEGTIELTNVCEDGTNTKVTIMNTGQKTVSGQVVVDSETPVSFSSLAAGAITVVSVSNIVADDKVETVYTFTSTKAGTVSCKGPTYMVPQEGLGTC